MTEADLEREASRLYKQLGLKVGADSLDFFLVESVRLKDWKKLIKPPPLNNHIITNGNDWKMAEPNNAGIGMRPRHVKVRTDGRVVNGSSNSEEHKLKNNGDSNPESPPASFGDCGLCSKPVEDEENGCVALDQVYHSSCFKCMKCSKRLCGGSFYVIKEGHILCEKDYLMTLDRCYCCKQVIRDKVLRALGFSYHAVCFRCCVCGKCLDGIPFTTDYNKKIYCEADFHKTYAPLCSMCREPIIPLPGEKKARKVIALDMCFHVECYKCEDCGKHLADGSDEQTCYPIGDHLLCLSCNRQRLETDAQPDDSSM